MFTTPANLIFLVLTGAGVGVLGALLGTGGGVFLIPVLVMGFGVPMHYAIATSIVSVIATSSAVASGNVDRGTANMRLGMTLEIATALGAIAGGVTAAWLSATTLEMLFSLALMPTAVMMWRGREGEDAPSRRGDPADEVAADAQTEESIHAEPTRKTEPGSLGRLGAVYYDDYLLSTTAYQISRLWAGLAVSFLAGNLSGLLGIGGGVFKVPALHLLCRVPIKAAAATSNFMIGVTAAASAFLYFGRGQVRPALTAGVVLGVLLGSVVGSHLNRFMHGNFLRRLFAILLGAVAVQMLYRAWRGGV